MSNQMWYAVHFLKPKKNRVVPAKWIKSLDDQIEKFLNYRINTAQQFLIYYSEEPEARDDNDRPNEALNPKFNMDVDGDFPAEGCYMGRLLKVKRKCQNF